MQRSDIAQSARDSGLRRRHLICRKRSCSAYSPDFQPTDLSDLEHAAKPSERLSGSSAQERTTSNGRSNTAPRNGWYKRRGRCSSDPKILLLGSVPE
jgi:hypothetical protein